MTWARRVIVVIPLLAFVALAACGGGGSSSVPGAASAPAPAIQHKQLDVGGRLRAYRVYAPPSLDRTTPPPLVLVLGGVGNTAESMVQATEFDREAIDGGFVVVYPDGVDQTWNAGYCCGSAAHDGVDDVAFLSAVIDQVQSEYRSDPTRVFVTGVSNGAMMAYRMGCELAPKIAGVGSVAGAMLVDGCHPARPVPVIEIHGTADPLVPYAGGATAGGATEPSPPTTDVAERWAALDGCPSPPAVQAGSPVTTSTWTGCRTGAAIRLVAIEGAGHTWFAAGLGPANGALDATHELWSFFSGLRRSG